MTKSEYLEYAIKNEYYLDKAWYYSMMSKLISTTNYVNVRNKTFIIEGKEHNIEDYTNPLFVSEFPVYVKKTTLTNLEADVKTTFGRVIFNAMLSYCFQDRIPYVNEKTSVGKIEKKLAKMILKDKVSVQDYKKFAKCTVFLAGLSRLTNVSATYKNILPPDGIEELKKELLVKYDKEYGPEWRNDKARVLQYQEELIKKDREWLKDDPSDGKLISGKIKENARVKMFLASGAEQGFDKTGENIAFVNNSLLDGYSADKKQLAALFNTSRSASYDRGKNTQQGGAAAKDILRAISSFTIKQGDCGSRNTKTIIVNDINKEFLVGRYVGNKILETTDIKVGSALKIRSPMYCIQPGSTICSTCAGRSMSVFQSGVNLLVLSVSNVLLTISLKAMHKTQTKLYNFDITKALT